MAKGRISVEAEGLDELRRALTETATAMRSAAEDAVGEETEAVAQDMRDGAPIDEGELVESIQAEHDGLEGTAAATARHAEFVEHGTSKMPAQPFAQPAAETSRTRFPQRVGDMVREAVE